uniref:Neuropeptide f 1 n=1 Tax=Deroceras reticulatum TaxID=145610 RepID=A0A1X9WEG3_DERRE|nr:neuropeptide f 1 [Deroceras reticulatum]
MFKLLLVFLFVVSVAIMEVSSSTHMLSPPERPREFRNPNELRQYLKELNEYYAIMGRPRFGKRAGATGYTDYLSPSEWEDVMTSQ